MHDSFITALNTQRTTLDWMDAIVKNMSNIYTPGYRETQFNFKTFLDGTSLDDLNINTGQGKSFPGTSPENVFLEGNGFFLVRRDDGKILYTRRGEFKFDGEGVYKTTDGKAVQGYILNENGEVLAGTKVQNGDPSQIPTTGIKMWIDPGNGKYLGKYDEYEIKEDGIIYGKADKGKIKVPLYKIAIQNFHNPSGLREVNDGEYIETDASGKPVAGKGDIRSGLIELSNADLRANMTYFQQAKLQMDVSNKLVSTNKDLLNEVMRLLGS